MLCLNSEKDFQVAYKNTDKSNNKIERKEQK